VDHGLPSFTKLTKDEKATVQDAWQDPCPKFLLPKLRGKKLFL